MSKNGVFSGPYFPVFSSNTGKYVPGKTPYLDTYHSVKYLESWFKSDRRNGRLIVFLLCRLFLNLYQKRKVLYLAIIKACITEEDHSLTEEGGNFDFHML